MSLIRGDATAIPLADNSVDLIVTSPPYFALRSYQDGGEHYDGQIGSEATPQDFLEALWAVTAECRRVLKPSGSMFVNLGDKYSGSDGASGAPSKQNVTARGQRQRYRGDFGGVPAKSLMGLPWRYAIGCIDQLDLILRAEIVWSKPNGLPESVTDRVRRSHEQWFHFTKEPRYYAAVDEIREAYAPGTSERYAAGFAPIAREDAEITKGYTKADGGPSACNPLGKLPGSVWSIPSEPLKVPPHIGVDHFAAFPQEWPRRLILGWSPPGICTVCGEGRRPIRGRSCEECSTLIPAHAKTCPGCGGRRAPGEWKEGRLTDAALRVEEHKPGLHAPRNPQTHRIATEMGGYVCACPTPDAPTSPAVVLDPFAGTGTTVMVARALGRYGVGLDLSADYLKLARWRVYDSGHAAKTVARTNRERQGVLL